MQGYLTKKRNHWYVVVTDRDPVTNKRKTRWVSTGETDEEKAQAFYHRTMHELNEGLYDLDATTATVGDVLKSWLHNKEVSVDLKTYTWYTYLVDKHLHPDLGHSKLKDLTGGDLTLYYKGKLQNGSVRFKGKGLTPSTIRYLHKVMSMALGAAVDQQVIRKNVALDATVPKAPKKEIEFWLPEETRQFLSVAEHASPYYLYYATALGTGMRPNEVAAIKWRDIDFMGGAVLVQRSLRRASNDLENREKEPKTENGRRRIDISPGLLELLKAHRKRQDEYKKVCPDYKHKGMVFAKPDGDWINTDGIQRGDFKRTIKEAKVPVITLVGLRHTHATELLMRGVPTLIVSERLGHFDVAFTQRIYGHVIPSVQKCAAQLIDDMFTKPGQTAPNKDDENADC